MDADRHERLMEILGDALELAEPERQAFIERQCHGDSEMRAEVDRMLSVQAGAKRDFLTEGVEKVVENLLAPPPEIGPYKLIKPIGEGGMGLVYLAEQRKPVQRTVALKLIRPGMDTREVISRFASERQALAKMSHPNVAQVYEAGATDMGRPYFVMEYVDGKPITTWCDEHRSTTAQRLALFDRVCDAVQHAHQKGIIHRDLKPGNVLITEQDGRPVPKVIDFGVSKATEQQPRGSIYRTQIEQMIGTPEYMSPEQAAGGDDVDTRTDVYSLGVLLYELLTGVQPFEGTTLRSAGREEIRRLIREVDPPRPSTRLSALGAKSGELAARRSMDARSLRRALKGDLDWIVMKAMEKDRERRYGSPSELAADIGRYMRDEAVVAGPPTRSYRMRKFVVRHRNWVAAGASVGLVLVGGIMTTTWQAYRALRAESEIKAEQKRTLTEKLLAEHRLDDIRELAGTFMFKVDTTLQTAGPTKARQMIVETSLKYLDKLAYQSAGDVALQRELFRGYLRVGNIQYFPGAADLVDPAGALRSYKKALEIAEDTLRTGKESRVARDDIGVALVHIAEAEAELGRYEDALASFDRALAIQEDLRDELHNTVRLVHTTAIILDSSSQVLAKMGRYDEALKRQHEALRRFTTMSRANPRAESYRRESAAAQEGIGRIHRAMGKLDEARVEFESALLTFRDMLSRKSDNPIYQRDVARTLGELADVCLAMDQPVEALAFASEAEKATRSIALADLNDIRAQIELARALETLGNAQLADGDRAAAVDSWRRGWEIASNPNRTASAGKRVASELLRKLTAAGATTRPG